MEVCRACNARDEISIGNRDWETVNMLATYVCLNAIDIKNAFDKYFAFRNVSHSHRSANAFACRSHGSGAVHDLLKWWNVPMCRRLTISHYQSRLTSPSSAVAIRLHLCRTSYETCWNFQLDCGGQLTKIETFRNTDNIRLTETS